jgi:hypothetical protein
MGPSVRLLLYNSRGNSRRWTNTYNYSDEKDIEPILERKLRCVSIKYLITRLLSSIHTEISITNNLYVSEAKNQSVIAVQVFDQKKFKKKGQGFLGVVNVQVGNVFDVSIGGDGKNMSTISLLLLKMWF